MNTNKTSPVLLDENVVLDEGDIRKRVAISRGLCYVNEAGVCVILHWHEPLFRFAFSDKLTLRYAAVHLRLANLATQEEVATAFGHSVATQRRWENRYQADGLNGLINKKSPGRPSAIPNTLDGVLRKWFADGVSSRAMAQRLQVGETTIKRALARLGCHRQRRPTAGLAWSDDSQCATEGDESKTADDQCEGTSAAIGEMKTPAIEPQPSQSRPQETEGEVRLQAGMEAKTAAEPTVDIQKDGTPNDEGTESERSWTSPCDEGNEHERQRPMFGELLEDVLAEYAELGFTIDRDPDNRMGDRALARLGQLEDALPLFGDRPCQRQAGVLLAIPLLVKSGLLEAFSKTYHSLAPAFYGLRTTVVVLFLCALLRIRRPESLKEWNPQELGHLVGLDRLPEVKTVRRKLEHMAAYQRARELMGEVAQRRISEDPERVAFLYIDGHVRPYYGQHPLAKTKKAQDQVARPGATDNWVHDANGEPLLVVTSEMNEALTQVLEPILTDVKQLVGDRRPVVIFDRGGFSPKLFARLNELGFDVMTYRKGKSRPWPVSHFKTIARMVEGRRYVYRVAERRRVRIGRLRSRGQKSRRGVRPQYLWMREVRVLREDDRQTSILTTRQDLEQTEVAYRQFNRWRQENYFKYMDAEFALDALLEYGVQDVDQERDRPNPERRPLERELAAARTRVQRLQAQLGAAVDWDEASDHGTVGGFKVAHAELLAELSRAESNVARIHTALKSLPRRVSAAGLKTLKTEKKLIVDTIKMAAYQVETRLLGLLGDHYARTADEGRTLLQAAFQSTGRIEVRGEELYVELAPQSSPHRTKAVASLCTELNALGTTFPGTRLRLKLAIRSPEPLTTP